MGSGVTIGFAIGIVVGKVLSDKLSKSKFIAKETEQNRLYDENNRLTEKNKKDAREIEDLRNSLENEKSKNRAKEDVQYDLQDDLEDMKLVITKLRHENAKLNQKLEHYKITVEARDAEIEELKSK